MQLNWGGAFEGWARNFVTKNHWRVRRYVGDYNDAVQQCALVFCRCKNAYENKENMNERWFMSLFMTAVSRHFHIISTKDTNMRAAEEVYTHHDVDGEGTVDGLVNAWESATDELKLILSMISDGTLDDILLDEKADLNKRWRKVTKYRGRQNMLTQLKDLLGC